MRRNFFNGIFLIGTIVALSPLLLVRLTFASETYQEITDLERGLYDSLAIIIEQNMQNPEQCVAEVEKYYQQNLGTIQKIKELKNKFMKDLDAQIASALNHIDPSNVDPNKVPQRMLEMEARGKEILSNNPRKKYEDIHLEFSSQHLEAGMLLAQKEEKYFFSESNISDGSSSTAVNASYQK